jgi:hypothetical protein
MNNIIKLPRDPAPDDLQSIIDAYLEGRVSLHIITVDRDNEIQQYSFGNLIPEKVSAGSRNRA